MQSKGQGIAIDLFLGVAIFLLLLTAVLAIWSNTETTASKELTEKEMQQMAENALDRLIRSKGDPADWEQSEAGEVIAIGLAKSDRVIDENKLKQFPSGGIDRGLVAHYKFDEGTGTTIIADSSGNGNNGMVTGTLTESIDCPSGDCLSFGGSAYASVTIDTSKFKLDGKNETMLMWVKHNNSSYAVGKLDRRLLQTTWVLKTLASDATCPLQTCELSAIGSNDNQWHLVAYTISDKTITSFVDDEIKATKTLASSNITPFPSELRFGEYSGTYYTGFIDEVRIYNRALSASEIKALYENPDLDLAKLAASPFVKQKLLIGDNNYFFRLIDRRPVQGSSPAKVELKTIGVDPKKLEPEVVEKLIKTRLLRTVVYTFKRENEGAEPHEAVVEFILHRKKN